MKLASLRQKFRVPTAQLKTVARKIRESLGSDDPDVWVKPYLDEMFAMDVRSEIRKDHPELDVDDPAVWHSLFEARKRELGLSA